MDLDPNRLQLPNLRPTTVNPSKRPPRHKTGERFLKGPIPWSWLTAAARLPGKALHVAIVLWFKAGMANRRTVSVSLSGMKQLGVARNTARRGLAALERGELVDVERKPGCSPTVTLLDLPTDK